METYVIVAIVLFTSVFLTLLLNGFVIANYTRRRRLRANNAIASNILYVYLAAIDIIGTLLWSTPAAASALTEGELWHLDCYFRIRVRVFCNVANAFMLTTLMLDRYLRIYCPEKRQVVHIRNNALIIVMGISVASLLITCSTSFPKSTLQDIYHADFVQCEYDFQSGALYFVFTTSVYVIVPFLCIAMAYAAILIRVGYVMRIRAPKEYAALKDSAERSTGSGYGYFLRMKTQLDLLEGVASKEEKPDTRLEKNSRDDGYHDLGFVDSSDDEFETSDWNKEKSSQELYLLIRDDVKCAQAYALISLIYFGLWVPYYIRMFQYTFDGTSLGDMFVQVAVCLIHYGGVVKLPFYLLSDAYRGAVLKTCRRRRLSQ